MMGIVCFSSRGMPCL